MAFFDELGKKISQTGQMAVQKTKEMADVAKLNSTISDEEKKINNAYYQIGELYVSLHNDDFEPDFEVLITQIRESQNNIESLKKQIQDIKGVKRCTTCGAEIPNNATFCSSCGSAVIQQKAVDAANLIKCSSCGKMIEKDMKFCTFCGSKIVTQTIRHDEKKCLSCGAVLDDGVAFCTHCGTPVPKDEENKIADIATNENTIDDTTPGQSEMPSDVIPKERIAEPIKKRCTNCGSILEEDSMFCTECGTKVN